MKRLVLLALAGLCMTAAAQQGRLTVVGDTKAGQMVEKHVELASRTRTVQGYRVQIASFSGTGGKQSAFNLRDRFRADYPSVQAYIVFDEPNFKVKVGDFRTRLEAYAFMQQIKDVYKGYLVKDFINPEPPEQQEFAPDDEQSGDE
ncbi:MAG: SPOR domain-containing protein [Bacteroidales bacterium]|nr:SPOR domain-containing protein [Bacteroidales bacterium]